MIGSRLISSIGSSSLFSSELNPEIWLEDEGTCSKMELGLEDEDIVSAVEIKCVVARAKYNWLKV